MILIFVEPKRSSCLHIGAFFVIRKIIAEYHLDQIIEKIVGKDAGLFLDLAAYTIVTENNPLGVDVGALPARVASLKGHLPRTPSL